MAALDLQLIELPEDYRTYLVRVDPSDPDLRDIDGEPDMAFWLVDMIAYDRTVLSLPALWRQMVAHAEFRLPGQLAVSEPHRKALAEAYLLWVLRHPRTPWGLGFRHKDKRSSKHFSMTVIYRGERFTRDRRGVMTPVPDAGRVPGFPTEDEWRGSHALSLQALELMRREEGA